MSEIVFLVKEDSEGGYTARAIGESIFTEAGSIEEINRKIREAVLCHFSEEKPFQIVS